MKNDYKELKSFILLFCSIILYAVLFSLGKSIASIININSNYMNMYNIICVILSMTLTIIFFISWLKRPYEELIVQAKKYVQGISCILLYFLLSNAQNIPFSLLNIEVASIPTYLRIIYLICYEAILIGIIVLINFKTLKIQFLDLKKNHNKYFKQCFKYWLIGLLVMYVNNFILSQITTIATNEQTIRQQLQLFPIYTFISAVAFAPILEELIFRLSFKNLFRNKYLFVIVSGLVFGALHILTGSMTNPIEFLYIISYGSLGMAFAYMLVKTQNIFVSMGFHMLHNGIMVSLLFLYSFFL